jgi:hypothetical protein
MNCSFALVPEKAGYFCLNFVLFVGDSFKILLEAKFGFMQNCKGIREGGNDFNIRKLT